MNIPRDLALRLARHSALLWVAVRVLGSVAFLWVGVRLFGSLLAPLRPLPFGIVFFPMLVLTVGWIDLARGDRVLLADLGIRPAAVTGILLGVAVALEALTALALAWAGHAS